MSVSPSFVPRLAKKARLRFDRHSGRYMIIYPERGLELNDSAAEIAKRMDGTKSVMDIAEDIVRETNIDPSQRDAVLADVVEFIDGLQKKGLVETVE